MLANMTIREPDTPTDVKEEPEEGGWIFPKKVVNTVVVNSAMVPYIPRTINWFELLENDGGDPYGPIPADWTSALPDVPRLPEMSAEEMWREM